MNEIVMKEVYMRRIRIIISVILFGLFFVSCSRREKERSEGSSVSFKLDSQTVQKIKAAAGETGGAAASISARNADSESAEKIFIELAVRGDFEKATVVEVQKEATISIDDIPMDSEIYLEATAFIKPDGERQNLYKGHSKKFIVRNSENLVMFILHKVKTE